MINHIKEYRKRDNLTQEELANKLGVTRQTIIAIENNKYNPTLELAMRLSKYLDVTVEELFILPQGEQLRKA
jgi:putative transcriptional regulator